MKNIDIIKNKIKKLNNETISEIESKRIGKKLVTTNGCFDLLHSGHLYSLALAFEQGDMLVIGLNSDISVKENKGNSRPIIDEESRALALACLPFVDYVVIYDESTSEEFVRKVKPNVHVNSSVYGENCVERPILDSYGGELVMIDPLPNSPSTTSILEKINHSGE